MAPVLPLSSQHTHVFERYRQDTVRQGRNRYERTLFALSLPIRCLRWSSQRGRPTSVRSGPGLDTKPASRLESTPTLRGAPASRWAKIEHCVVHAVRRCRRWSLRPRHAAPARWLGAESCASFHHVLCIGWLDAQCGVFGVGVMEPKAPEHMRAAPGALYPRMKSGESTARAANQAACDG